MQASQIALTTDRTIAADRYDTTTIILHWLTAALVVTLFALGEIWGFLPKAPLRHGMQYVHFSLGLALIAVVVLRILWRASLSRRLPPVDHGLLGVAAHAMHYVLYLLLLTMMCSGPVWHWTEGYALPFFGLFQVPEPFAIPTSWHGPAAFIHFWAAWGIVVLAGLHAVAALFHHYVLKDGTLRRMMPGR